MSVHPPQIPHKVIKDSTAALQSEDSTLLPDIKIQQNSCEMCTAQLCGHTDNAMSIDTRKNTKCWKERQLTDNGYQDLQHHWLISDRILKRISDTMCTTIARTRQQDCLSPSAASSKLPTRAFKFYFG